MFTIINEISSKITIQKSKFISYVFYCKSQEEMQQKLKEVKRQNLSANHVCYGCCFYENKNYLYYSSDDGEPSGTAGLQICQAIKENQMVNMLIVVVRYFGGIKLGVPGLSKAYKDSAKQVIVENKKEVFLRNKYLILCEYNKFNEMKKILDNLLISINEIKFDDAVSFNSYLTTVEFNKISSLLKEYEMCENTENYI